MTRPCLWTASPPSSPVTVLPPTTTAPLSCLGWRMNEMLAPKFSPFLFMLSLKKKQTKNPVWWGDAGGGGDSAKNGLITSLKKESNKKRFLKKSKKKSKHNSPIEKKCWREVWSSVDWRHFGTERRPHTWHHAEGRERLQKRRMEWQRAGLKGMQNNKVIQGSRNDEGMGVGWSTWQTWRKRPASPPVNAMFRRGGGRVGNVRKKRDL